MSHFVSEKTLDNSQLFIWNFFGHSEEKSQATGLKQYLTGFQVSKELTELNEDIFKKSHKKNRLHKII